MSIQILLLVGAGSFIGGILRYVISVSFYEKYPNGFPWWTFFVNVLGCLLIGLFFGYAERWNLPKEWRLFFATGFLGGFTTFSAFSHETISLVQHGQIAYAVTYVLSSVILGLSATFLGIYLLKT